MTPATRLSRPSLALLIAVAIAVGGCGSPASTANAGNGPGCDKWCGTGSASVTFAGATATVSGGGCYDTGAAGVDARFGDWQGDTGGDAYLMLTVYHPGALVPTPLTTAPAANSTPDTGPAAPTGEGSIDGQPFILAPGAILSIRADGTGSFSGTDVNGGGPASGTFSCH
jgi:hypothetical protein